MNTQKLKNYGTRIILELLEKYEGKEGLKKVQIALNTMGKNLTVDGMIGNISIHAIKSVNNKILHQHLYTKKEIPLPISTPSDRPSWVTLAYEELGVKERHGNASNPRIEQYHDTAKGFNWKDDVPWCGSFIAFIMIKSGEGSVKNAFRAKAWKKFGTSISHPVLGAIAIKSRQGGGHVGLIVGISQSGKSLYILGGNQNDEVNIKRYPKNVFTNFRVPLDYKETYTLPIMSGTATVTSEA